MTKDLVIGLVAQNENGALQASASNMEALFATMGYRHQVIDLLAPQGISELSSALQQGRVAFAYGFAGVGSQLQRSDGSNLWTATKTPFVALWFDHPAYHYQQHIVDSPYIIHGYHVRDHLEARQKYLVQDYTSAFLLPQIMGGNPQLTQVPWEERAQKILYVKTALEPGSWAKDWERHPTALQQVMWGLVEQAKADRNIDLTGAMAQSFSDKKLNTEDLRLLMGVVQEVDAYIRGWRSDRMARALLPHDAVIAGRGWDYLMELPRKAVFIAPFPAHELPHKIAAHRVAINTNPLWRHGVHERVLMGLESGSVTLTDRSIYADEIFSSLPQYAGFEWDDNLGNMIESAWQKSETPPCPPEQTIAFFHERAIATHHEWREALKTALAQLAQRIAA